jgi:hypothetical protein
VLFRAEQHEPIANGDVTLSFRAWSRPQAKVGGRYRLGALGMIEVDAVDRVTVGSIDAADARRCGATNLKVLRASLDRTYRRSFADGDDVVRIAFHFAGPDERPAPPAFDDDLSNADLADLLERLARMDGRSAHGVWTARTLRLVAERPRTVAAELARDAGRETAPFKADVRKLKKLGLTLSHDVGYELSPRGRALLPHLDGA